MATLVYRYGLQPPAHNADLARRHLRAAHRYRNLLIEAERGRRAAMRVAEQADPALAGVDVAIGWLDSECQSLARQAKQARSAGRTRAIAQQLRAELRESRARLKRAKRGRSLYRAWWLRPRLQAERDRINNLAAELKRNIRQHRRDLTGELLYHGTYSGVESAVDASRKAPLWDGGEPNDPRFLRWRGERYRYDEGEAAEGTLGVQLQGGATWAELSDGSHTRAQIAPRTRVRDRSCRPGRPGVHRRCSPGRCTLHDRDPDRRRGQLGGRGTRQAMTLRLRQESEGREPVWVEWPMRIHRPLPDGALVTWIDVHCRTTPGDIGPREEWYATLRLRLPEQPRRNDGLAVAVDVGWRALADGSLRVGYWVGEDGRHDQLVLSPGLLAALTRADGIRAARDRLYEQLVRGLADWIDATPAPFRPAWLSDARRRMADSRRVRWRSPRHMRRLMRQWRSADVPAPAAPRPAPSEVHERLCVWSRYDDHLAGYESGQRRKAQRRRQDHYRRFAAWLSERYDVVVLEDFDKRTTNRTALTEDGAQTEGVALHHTQRLAWTSGLCTTLKSRFGQRGIWIEVVAANTTQSCHVDGCGGVLDGDAADGIVQRCTSGHVWDQDENAARNMLGAWGRERSGGEQSAVTARSDRRAKRETKWERAKRLKRVKDARIAAAREAEGNAAE